MSSILDNVSCKLNDEDLIDIILKYRNEDISINNSLYEYFRNDVPNNDNKECVGYENFFVEYFKKSINKIWYYQNPSFKEKEEEFFSIESIISSSRYNGLRGKPVFFRGKNSDYRTIYVDGSYGKGIKEKYDCRLYMCPKMENIIPIVEEIISMHNELNLNCYLKFNINSNDNDRITVYSSLENIDKHLDIIKKVKEQHPRLFESMGRNKLWGNIKGFQDVYFGMNPYLFNSGSSYLAIRSTIIESALIELKNKFIDLNNCSQITYEMLEYFKQMIRVYSIVHNVNPDNFCLNINNESKKKGKSPITLKRGTGDLPIVANYLLPQQGKVIISSPYYCKDSNSFLIITVDDLEKLYKNDASSEKLKKYLLKKVELLHTKSKISSGFKLRKAKNISITGVETDIGSINSNGEISYGLYISIPTKISSYMCLSSSKFDQHKRGTIDVETLEKISTKTDEIFDIKPEIINNSKKVIKDIEKEQKEKQQSQQKRLVVSRR